MVFFSASKLLRTGGSTAMRPPLSPFSQVVIRFAFQLETDAVGQERTETLACRTFEFDVDGLFRKSCLPVFLGNRSCQHAAPTERSVLAMVYSREISFPVFYVSPVVASMVTSFTWAMSCFCSMTWCMAAPLSTRCSSLLKSNSEDFFSLGACCIAIRSIRPMISSNRVNPISDRYSRTS